MSKTPPLLYCRLLTDWRAPKNVGGKVMYKSFRQDQVIQGHPFNQASTPANYVEVIKTKDGYIIPTSNLNILGRVDQPKRDVPEAVEVKDSDYISDKSRKAVADATNGGSVKDIIAQAKQQSKVSMQGALIGAGVGLVWAMMKGKNKLVFLTIGAVVGGVGGTVVNKFRSKK